MQQTRESLEVAENLIGKIYGTKSEKLTPVFNLQMQIAVYVDKNEGLAFEISKRLVEAVEHTSGPQSVMYLTRLCNHVNFKLDLQYDGKDLVEEAQKAAKLAETILKDDNSWKA